MILVIGGSGQGKRAYAERFAPAYRIEDHFEERIREALLKGEDPLEMTKEFLRKRREPLLVILPEEGCGLVPTDPGERVYRDALGVSGICLAAEADTVIRVFCGIGTVIKGSPEKTVYLMRHGMTAGNYEGRYVGRTDEGILSGEKERILRLRPLLRDVDPSDLYLAASPMKRCLETAAALFPELEPCVYGDLRECDFGAYEYHNYEELKDRPDYQLFIDSYGESGFPEGEGCGAFKNRSVRVFEECLNDAGENLFVSAHGGTIMSVLEAFSGDGRRFYEWPAQNACIYRCVFDVGLHRFTKIRLLDPETGCFEIIDSVSDAAR